MTLQEFLIKWNGKYCEVAGSANAQNQCVDLANAYIRDVLGLPIIEWTNAIDFPSKGGDKYTYILNTPTGVPSEGDLVIWGNSPGHIAIFLDGNANSFTSFDQNYPTGSPCHIQGHTYANVLGWMHPKTLPQVDQECMPKSQAEDFRRVKEGWNQLRALLNVEDSVTAVLGEVKKFIDYEKTLRDQEKKLGDANLELGKLKNELKEETDKNKILLDKASVLTEKASDLEDQYKEAVSNNEKALQRIHDLEQIINKPQSTGWQKIIDGFFELIGRK